MWGMLFLYDWEYASPRIEMCSFMVEFCDIWNGCVITLWHQCMEGVDEPLGGGAYVHNCGRQSLCYNTCNMYLSTSFYTSVTLSMNHSTHLYVMFDKNNCIRDF